MRESLTLLINHVRARGCDWLAIAESSLPPAIGEHLGELGFGSLLIRPAEAAPPRLPAPAAAGPDPSTGPMPSETPPRGAVEPSVPPRPRVAEQSSEPLGTRHLVAFIGLAS